VPTQEGLIIPITGRSFTYSVGDHLLTAGTTLYDYDLDGFLTTRTNGAQVTAYDYSSRGELLSVTLPDGKQIDYIHDPFGRRIAKKVNGSITEKYLWQGLTTLLAVYDGSNNLLMRFEYADSRLPVAVEKEGVKYYLTYDQVGTLKLVADASGNVVKKIEYDSFGNIITDSAPAFEIPFRFAGGLYDTDTGLVRFGFRDYDPEIGRWTAKDPIGFAGGDTDLYGYVLNDPVNFIDPWGLTQQDIDIAVEIIKETQKDLRFPNTVDPSMKSDKYAGEYQMLTDTIKLNENYLKDLTDTQAADLLDTLIHETLHANDSAWKLFLDSLRDHPDIYNEADRRTKEILDRYLNERKQNPCE
jgi:RHS repeat-associated protein